MTDPAPLWILSVPARTAEESEALQERLTDLCGASPVELETVDQRVVWLESYFEDETEAFLIRDVISGEFSELEIQVRPCPARDWTTFWRHHFKPREIGKKLMIVPEWMRDEVAVPEGRERVLVNPGLSFGTGDHFTTRYCLEMLDTLAGEGICPGRAFDAGCGSAIISIAARKLGWPSILAVDNDPVAVNQARENLELNAITEGIDLQVMDLTREFPREQFPVVFANIYGGLLMDLAPQLLRICSHTLILSGIRVIEAEAVSSVFTQLGAVEKGSDADHEWCGLRLEIP
jgi:ribosomal protein L11 methyltransferase